MGISSSQLQPQELVTFKKLPTSVPLENIEIPERPENRRPTNVKWLIMLGVFLVLLVPFMIYTLYYADGRRLIPGYDQCGNICGTKNYHWDGIDCSGKDQTNYPYLEYTGDLGESWHSKEEDFDYDLLSRHCVSECESGTVPFWGRCIKGRKKDYGSFGNDVDKVELEGTVDIGLYLDSAKWQIIISCLLSILVAMGMLFLFRYAVAFVVWGMLIGCFLGVVLVVGGIWYLYSIAKEEQKYAVCVFALIFTVIALVLGIVLIWCRRKIRLVILLLKETSKAIFTMPGLIACPLVCVLCILIVTILFGVTSFYMNSAGVLQHIFGEYYTYYQNPVMIFTMIYDFVAFLWIVQFFTGIQYMVVAGAVSKWYFSRDKNYLGSPILTSLSNTFKFHLGTVALGGLIITIIQVIKAVIMGLIKNERVRALFKACYEVIENFFKFLSKNAYIVTAMHGQAFIRSGKRAAKLLFQNLGDVIAINYIGDFVLGMAQMLIVVISVLLSMLIFTIMPTYVYVPSHLWSYIIVAIVSVVVAAVSFGVFETTIDTIFICYCEDNLLNDGMARPYFMSRNLMEFVQKSKEVYGKK